MKTVLYVHSGTGNSLWAAQQLASHLPPAEVVSMTRLPSGPVRPGADAVGLLFPVHMWGVPRVAREFVRRLEVDRSAHLFAVAVNAGQVARTLVQLREELAERSLVLASGYSLLMPTNYLPWGGPGPADEMQRRFAAARTKLEAIATGVRARRVEPVEQGPLWQRVVFTPLYNVSYPRVPTMDAAFSTDDRCNGCGTCVRVCPAGNVELVAGRPRWSGRCDQCMACAQWCPTQALQASKKTARFERYHHPEIKLADMVRLAKPGA